MQSSRMCSENMNDLRPPFTTRLWSASCASDQVKHNVMKYLVINQRCGTCAKRLRAFSQIGQSPVLCDTCLNNCVKTGYFTCGYCHRSQFTMQLAIKQKSNKDCVFTCDTCIYRYKYYYEKHEMVQIYTKTDKLSNYISRCAIDIRDNCAAGSLN